VVGEALAHDGDGLEAAMRMLRKTGHDVAVVHAPAVFDDEVLSQVAAHERRGWAHLLVARGVRVIVMNAEEEGIRGDPRKP